MRAHVLDLGLNASDIEAHFEASGYWDTPDKRVRHACVRSPSAYVLDEESVLDDSARVLYRAVTQLEIKLASLARKSHRTHAQSAFLRTGTSAAHGLLLPGEDLLDSVPPFFKVDLVRDCAGTWKAVEVDVYNLRPFGTIALVDSLAAKAPASSLNFPCFRHTHLAD